MYERGAQGVHRTVVPTQLVTRRIMSIASYFYTGNSAAAHVDGAALQCD